MKITPYTSGDESTYHFRIYLSLIRDQIEAERKEIEETCPESWYDEETGIDVASDRLHDLHNLEQIMLQCFSVGVLMSIESMLVTLCGYIQRKKKYLFKYTDIAGSRGLGQARKYLQKVLSSEIPSDIEKRSFFEIAILIRNASVHSESRITNKHGIKKIQEFIQKHPNILRLRTVPDHATDIAWLDITLTYDYANMLIDLNEQMGEEVAQHGRGCLLS